MHAYSIHPYIRTLRTNALINNNLTLTLEIPMILQFVHIDQKLLFAAFKRALKILSGFVALLSSMIPKYLNYETVSISLLSIIIYALQLINIALVFPILIVRELALQKEDKRCSKAYNSYGEGAINTRSSAYANINNYNDANVYAARFSELVLFSSKYYNKYGYNLSKNSMKSSGEAPSPYLTPIFAKYS
jgi:hypothetical protein